jgi:hypothetical protein
MASKNKLFPSFEKIIEYLIENDFYDENECYEDSCLKKAASDNRLDVVEYLICCGCGGDDWTHYWSAKAAVKSEYYDVAVYFWFIMRDAYQKCSIIKDLIKKENINLALELIEYVDELNLEKYLKTELIQVAAKTNQTDLIKFFIKKYDLKPSDLAPAMIAAIKGKYLSAVKYIANLCEMSDNYAYVNYCTSYGNVEILDFLSETYQYFHMYKIEWYEIIERGDLDMFVYLVEKMDLNLSIFEPKNKMLACAAANNCVEIMHYLIQHGQSFTKNGYDALSATVSKGKLEAFRYIMSTNPKQAMIEKAAQQLNGNCNIEMARILIPLNKKGNILSSMLRDSIYRKNISLAEYLIDTYEINLDAYNLSECLASLVVAKATNFLAKFFHKYNITPHFSQHLLDATKLLIVFDDYLGVKFMVENYFRPNAYHSRKLLSHCSSLKMLKYLISLNLKPEPITMIRKNNAMSKFLGLIFKDKPQ